MPKAKKSASHAGAAQPGDKVKITCGSDEYIGVLLPEKSEGSAFAVVKLPSGYNIGISKGRIGKIETLEASSAQLAQATIVSSSKSTASGKSSKEFLSLLACGGTIVNKIDYRTGAVHPATSPEELVAGIPGVQPGEIRAKMLFSIASEDMAPAHWVKMAEETAGEIKDGAHGVIITHGTDTMSYSASALSFMLQNLPCPVVFTGSQRSSDRGSSDAQSNLVSSVAAARADLSGIFICMHENMSDDSCAVHFGAKVRKMHTSRRDAFRSMNVLPAARVFPGLGKVEKISQHSLPRNPSAKLSLDTKLNTNVAMLYTYPGTKPEMVSSLSKYDGVVLIGTGLGHLPVNLAGDKMSMGVLSEVKQLIASGVPTVLVSQTIYGRVDMNVYSNQRALLEAGVIGNMCDFTPESAYVKLMWVLGREKKMEKVRKMMETSLVGEISERSEIVGY
jgi:glutamyl-tRNA(Gln) amidotransferase subunit D